MEMLAGADARRYPAAVHQGDVRMLSSELRGLLAASRLFQQADLAEVESLLGGCARHQLMPGDALIEAGARNTTLYLVLAGELRVYAGGRDLPANAMLGPGDCAGEMSLIDGYSASALVLAAAPTEVLAIPHERMWELLDLVPLVARNLLAIMSGRLRNNNLTLVTTQSRSLEFEQAGSVDTLTGLHNRRWIEESFMRLIRRCRQDGAPISLVMADVDLLAGVNERNGLLTGDNILRRIARCLAESLRPQDLLGRYGGDEFAILLPQTPLAEAQAIAARLCAAVAAAGIVAPPAHAAQTLSCGVTPVKAEDDLTGIFTRAEHALLQAKANGRNRVEVLG
jgi:diguanylate cyclase (GGDEF)-like protein